MSGVERKNQEAMDSNMRIKIDLRIARHGAVVLLLGMGTGFFISAFHNHGIGNAAHLTGLIGGYGLIAIGLLWPHLRLSRTWSSSGAWITIVSLYLNWLGLVVQANGSNSGARIGGVVLAIAVILSLASILIILAGLRNVSADPHEVRNRSVRSAEGGA